MVLKHRDLTKITTGKSRSQKAWLPLLWGFGNQLVDFSLCPSFVMTAAVLVVVEAFLSLQGVELEATQVVAVGIGCRSNQCCHAHRKHAAETKRWAGLFKKRPSSEKGRDPYWKFSMTLVFQLEIWEGAMILANTRRSCAESLWRIRWAQGCAQMQ